MKHKLNGEEHFKYLNKIIDLIIKNSMLIFFTVSEYNQKVIKRDIYIYIDLCNLF